MSALRSSVAAFVAATVLAAANQSQAGLVGHWTLDNDTTGLQNLGSDGATSDFAALNTMPTFTASGGFDGGGFATFNGTSQGLWANAAGNAAADIAATGGYPFTFAAWVRASGSIPPTASGRGSVVSISNSASSNQYYSMSVGYPEDGDFEAVRRNGAFVAVDADDTYATIHDGGWHHLAVVFEASNSASLYLDGALAATTAVDVAFPAGINAIGVGNFKRSSANGTDLYTGDIDDARIYDAALSAGEVMNLYLGVPEPSSLAMLACGGLAGLAAYGLRRRR